jgi:hypothetical protein
VLLRERRGKEGGPVGRIVVDTNLFAAGFNPASDAARVLAAVRAGTLRLVWERLGSCFASLSFIQARVMLTATLQQGDRRRPPATGIKRPVPDTQQPAREDQRRFSRWPEVA